MTGAFACSSRTSLTCPLLCKAKCAVYAACRRHPVVAQTQIPMVTTEILQMQHIDKVIDVYCAGLRCALSVETVEIPQLQHVSSRTMSLTYPLCSTTGAGVEVQKTASVPQLQHIRQGGRYPCWRSSTTRFGRDADIHAFIAVSEQQQQ